MSERGAFAVDRGIWDHDLLISSEPFSRREAWLWLVSEAAWKPIRRRIKGRQIELDRGQLAASMRFIASKWNWSEPRVRRFLDALILEGMVDANTDAGVSVITICKYDEYQFDGQRSDAMREADSDAAPTQERRKEEELKKLINSDDDGDAGARAPLIRSEAFSLASEIGSLCGHDPEFVPPQWCGAPMRVETWLAGGWTRDQIIPAVQGILANKRDGPPSSINYFEKGIATFIAKQNQPLPQVKIIEQETVNVRAEATGSVVQGADRALARMLNDSYGPGECDEPRPNNVRLLSQR